MFEKNPNSKDSTNPSSIFGYNGPEGLARCKELMRTRWRILVPLSGLFFILGVSSLILNSEVRPDIATLHQNFQAATQAEFADSGLVLSDVYLVEVKVAPAAPTSPAAPASDSPIFMTTWRYELTPLAVEGNSALWLQWEQRYPECLDKFKLAKVCTRQSQLLLPAELTRTR